MIVSLLGNKAYGPVYALFVNFITTKLLFVKKRQSEVDKSDLGCIIDNGFRNKGPHDPGNSLLFRAGNSNPASNSSDRNRIQLLCSYAGMFRNKRSIGYHNEDGYDACNSHWLRIH